MQVVSLSRQAPEGDQNFCCPSGRDRERGGCPMTLSEVLQLLAIIGGAVFVTFQITWTIANGNQNKKK